MTEKDPATTTGNKEGLDGVNRSSCRKKAKNLAVRHKNFKELTLKKSSSFPDFISEKIISIDKIVAFLQAFEHVISMFTTARRGIWVGLLVTSLREPS